MNLFLLQLFVALHGSALSTVLCIFYLNFTFLYSALHHFTLLKCSALFISILHLLQCFASSIFILYLSIALHTLYLHFSYLSLCITSHLPTTLHSLPLLCTLYIYSAPSTSTLHLSAVLIILLFILHYSFLYFSAPSTLLSDSILSVILFLSFKLSSHLLKLSML